MLGDTNFVPSVRRTLLHRGAKFDFESLAVTRPDGSTLIRECVRHPGAVVIVPILDPTRLALIRNWRPSVEAPLWELPAGTLEQGEDPLHAAARELTEETGFRAATLSPLGRFHTSPGLSDERMWAYAATGLTPGRQALEADEQITVHEVTTARAFDMIRHGDISDAKTMLATYLALEAGLITK